MSEDAQETYEAWNICCANFFVNILAPKQQVAANTTVNTHDKSF